VAAQGQEAAPVHLAAKGKALLSVVVAEKSNDRVMQAATTLADYLGRMSGGQFKVDKGDGHTGIAIGVTGSFAKLPLPPVGKFNDSTTNEDYLLRSHAKGLYLIGASEQAVEHAVWDLLYRLGYRQFFPGDAWEVIPKNADPSIALNRLEHPSYHSRRIWYGFGAWDYNARPYADWCARNRATGGIVLHTGHAYPGIVARNKAEFATHPEYKGLVAGERKGNQFCISNPNLRRLVVEDALRQLAAKPDSQSISLEPADGGGWCECDKCRAMGKVSDRALTLANEVAEAVTKKYGDKFVGMYAYSEHSPPPTIQVHPRVIISVATAFVRGGYTVDQLLTGWAKQGATLGIREYYSVNTWDRDLPGAARGANLTYLKTTIPHFHSLGARFLSAESSDNWGCNGLGYYLAARMMWDVNEAKRTDELVVDFLDKAFGSAKEPMAKFYQLIDGSKKPLLSDDLIGRMYRHLQEAKKRTDDPAIHRRLHDLTLYTRYVEHYFDYSTAKAEDRQNAFENLIKDTYRMRQTMMVHAKALYRDLPARDKSLIVPKEAAWGVPEGKNPWKSSAPYSPSELDGILSAGIARRQLLDFEPVAFSTKLVPASKLKLPDVKDGSMGLYSRGLRTYYSWIDKEPASIALKVQGGRIYTGRGSVKLDLYPAAETEGKAVAHGEAAADKEEHSVLLQTTFPGLHRIEVKDAGAGTTVSWSEGQPMTVCSSPADPAGFHGRWSLYFYVPKGTKIVGGFTSGVGTLLDGDGRKIHTFDNKPGYFSIPVPSGQDGKLWKFQQCAGQRLLMTVPPFLARNANELLLPADVVERDAKP
jgi:hypothetical protein